MYKLKHLGLYKNIPKKRMFNSTPNYERDSYTLLQYKSHLRNEFLIPLKADGNGTGVATIRLQSTESQAINVTGAGRFYTNAQGTTGESTSAVVGTSLTPLYVKLNEGSCYLVLTKADKIFGFGSDLVNVITEAANAPFINGCNLGYKLHNVEYIRLAANTKSFFTGSIDNCSNLRVIHIGGNRLCAFTGSIDNCSNLRVIHIGGNRLCAFTGSIDNTPNLINLYFSNNLLSRFTGSIDNTPNIINLTFSNNLLTSLTGDIGKAVKCGFLRSHINTKCAFTYVTPRNDWTSAYNTLWVSCSSMTSTMVDNLLIDLDASGVMPTGERLINLNGLCGAVTSASAAARASLVSKGFTVVVNT